MLDDLPLLQTEKMKVQQIFNRGHSGCEVLLVSLDGDIAVIKRAKKNNPRAVLEINNNLLGSRNMQIEGLSYLLPEKFKFYQDSMHYGIYMSFLGKDIESKINESDNPESIYSLLLNNLRKIYSQTIYESREAMKESSVYVDSIRGLCIKNYQEYLLPKGLVDAKDINDILKLRTPVIDRSSFACWDLTPEDLFLVDGVLKYPDPKAVLRGVPIIDLACFAGVCKDSYKTKGSIEAYQTIETFAVEEIAPLLNINKSDAKNLFYLGRILQSSLSSRFAKDVDKARTNASISKNYLTKILNGKQK